MRGPWGTLKGPEELRWSLAAAVMVFEVRAIESSEVQPLPDGCPPASTVTLIPEDDWMESEVIMGFRVWQLMFLALAGLITVVVLLCCFMKCRVPRTKQEIEADFKRKEITRRFRFLLDKVQVEDTSLRTAIDRVNELYTNREKMKRKKKKKVDDEEEIISQGSSYLFHDERLTIVERVKKLVGLLKEDASYADSDSQNEKSDPSEEAKKQLNASDEEISVPDVKVVDTAKPRQSSEESQDSSETPPKQEEFHSKLSLLVRDSPPPPHDSLSLPRDSPPHSSISLLQDSPPRTKSSKSWTGQKSDSQESAAGRDSFGRQKTDSQDSYESTSDKQRQSSQESATNRESSGEEARRQKSDSQESRESDVERAESRLSADAEALARCFDSARVHHRRESLDVGKEFGSRWNKSAQSAKTNSAKNSKARDPNQRPT